MRVKVNSLDENESVPPVGSLLVVGAHRVGQVVVGAHRVGQELFLDLTLFDPNVESVNAAGSPPRPPGDVPYDDPNVWKSPPLPAISVPLPLLSRWYRLWQAANANQVFAREDEAKLRDAEIELVQAIGRHFNPEKAEPTSR